MYASASVRLPQFHPLPADVAVDVVCEKGRKTDHHRNVPDVLSACKGPQDDQDQIVGRIGQRKIGAAPEGQVDGQKAGGHRHGAGQEPL